MQGDDLGSTVSLLARALEGARFDPQHGGELFLRADAERALKTAAGADARVYVAGRDDAHLHAASFLGARFRPDLLIERTRDGRSQRVAVTVTLLRADAGPLAVALAGALLLSQRYDAVIGFVLDRRVQQSGPFGADIDELTAGPGSAGSARGAGSHGLAAAERELIDQLWARHRIRVSVRKQDPFGL